MDFFLVYGRAEGTCIDLFLVCGKQRGQRVNLSVRALGRGLCYPLFLVYGRRGSHGFIDHRCPTEMFIT